MKKLLIPLIFLLLLTFPALADTLLTEFTCDNLTVSLIRTDDGELVFVGCADGKITVSQPLPPDTELFTEDGFYGTAAVGFYRTDLPDCPWVEHYITWNGEDWRVTLTVCNAWTGILWGENFISRWAGDEYYGEITVALNAATADWLAIPFIWDAAVESLNTAGYEEINAAWCPEDSMDDEPDEAASAFLASHLPGWTLVDGRVREQYAMLLADDPDGVRRFVGASKTADGWTLTVSTPLPTGTRCDTYHAGSSYLTLMLPLPREKARVRDGHDTVYATVVPKSSTWLVTTLNVGDAIFTLTENGYETEEGHEYFGENGIDQDVTRIVWHDLPGSLEQAVNSLDGGAWRLVDEPGTFTPRVPVNLTNASGHVLLTTDAELTVLAHGPDGKMQVYCESADVSGIVTLAELIPDARFLQISGDTATAQSDSTVVHLAQDAGGWVITRLDVIPNDGVTLLPYGYRTHGSTFFFGDVEQNAAHADWANLPQTMDEALFGLNTADWRFTSTAVCTADEPSYTLCPDMPVKVIESDGETALVRILGDEAHEVTVPTASLSAADDQYRTDPYAGWYNNHAFETLETAAERILAVRDDGKVLLQDLFTGEIRLEFLKNLSESEPLAVCAALFPAYAFISGKRDESVASFLMMDEQGQQFFAGCVYEDGAWQVTRSKALPDSVLYDDYHSTARSFELSITHPDGLMDEWGDDPLWIDYTITCTGGAWRVTMMHNYSEEACFFVENGIYTTLVGKAYGTPRLNLNVDAVDWETFPVCLADAMAALAPDWGTIRDASAPLCEDADGSIFRTYLRGTPVQILKTRDHWAYVAINGGETRGWTLLSAIATGAEQYVDVLWPDGLNEYLPMTLAETCSQIELPEGTVAYDAPSGNPLMTLEAQFANVICDLGGGWFHLLDVYEDADYYVHTDAQVDWFITDIRPMTK